MSWFSSILDVANSVGSWMESNPTAASILGGAVAGGAQFYASKELQESQDESDEKAYQRRKTDMLENSKASSGIGASGYDGYSSKLTGGTGLLTNGILAKQ